MARLNAAWFMVFWITGLQRAWRARGIAGLFQIGPPVGDLGAFPSMADLWTSTPNASRDSIAAMIRLTQHAETQMLRRRIDLAWIAAAITTPDWTAPDPDPALMRSFKAISEFGGRLLRVVHRPDGKDVLVVTAHFDRSARP